MYMHVIHRPEWLICCYPKNSCQKFLNAEYKLKTNALLTYFVRRTHVLCANVKLARIIRSESVFLACLYILDEHFKGSRRNNTWYVYRHKVWYIYMYTMWASCLINECFYLKDHTTKLSCMQGSPSHNAQYSLHDHVIQQMVRLGDFR